MSPAVVAGGVAPPTPPHQPGQLVWLHEPRRVPPVHFLPCTLAGVRDDLGQGPTTTPTHLLLLGGL